MIKSRIDFGDLHLIFKVTARLYPPNLSRSVRVAERLVLPTSVHGVAGSNPAGGEILPEPKRRFIAQSLSCSPFHRLEMTEILLMERKTLTHPSKFKTKSVCLCVISWTIGWHVTKFASLYKSDRIDSLFSFGDLDLVFKVTAS